MHRRIRPAVFLASILLAASAANAGDPEIAGDPNVNVAPASAPMASEPVTNESVDEPIAADAARLAIPARPATLEEVGAMVVAAADAHQLPVPFFARLIWQESGFRADVVSWAGAQGIAQFMPATAVWRGLLNPREPIQSLYKSADYLR